MPREFIDFLSELLESIGLNTTKQLSDLTSAWTTMESTDKFLLLRSQRGARLISPRVETNLPPELEVLRQRVILDEAVPPEGLELPRGDDSPDEDEGHD